MKINKDTTYPLELFIIDKDGEPITGLSNSYTIYDSSDDSVVVSGSLTDQGLGVYTATYVFTVSGQYRIIYNTPSGYSDEIESIIVEESHLDLLKRILGLSQENYRIFDSVYNANHLLTSATVKTYATASDCNNDLSPIATYSMITEYNVDSEMTAYRMVKN